MKAHLAYSLLSIIFLIFLYALFTSILAQDYAGIDIIAGRIYLAKISGGQQTSRWAGIIGNLSGNLAESPYAFAKLTILTNGMFEITLPGENLKDGEHYFAILPINITFNTSKIRNVTTEDLEEYGLFNETNFPIFHPNYYENSDNPKVTFCCQKKNIMINGEWYTPFVIILKQNTEY